MSNASKFIVAAVVVVLIGACGILFLRSQQTSAALADMQTENEATRGQYAEAIGSIATIQDSLNAIVLGDDAMPLASGSYQTERSLTPNQGDEVLERIAVLRAGVERSKARIEQLDENLRKSGAKMEGLEKLIAGLRRNVAKKEVMIAQLAHNVDSLQTEVGGLTVANEEKRSELGTIFCLIGSKKDLTNAGAVIATGGVLGLGKTLKPTGHVDESLCMTIDTDSETTVEIAAKKVQVLSAQPATSYALEPMGDHTLLRILDPKEFRKVRHLIIVKTEATA